MLGKRGPPPTLVFVATRGDHPSQAAREAQEPQLHAGLQPPCIGGHCPGIALRAEGHIRVRKCHVHRIATVNVRPQQERPKAQREAFRIHEGLPGCAPWPLDVDGALARDRVPVEWELGTKRQRPLSPIRMALGCIQAAVPNALSDPVHPLLGDRPRSRYADPTELKRLLDDREVCSWILEAPRPRAVAIVLGHVGRSACRGRPTRPRGCLRLRLPRRWRHRPNAPSAPSD